MSNVDSAKSSFRHFFRWKLKQIRPHVLNLIFTKVWSKKKKSAYAEAGVDIDVMMKRTLR